MRRTNEDAFLHDNAVGALIVADGMGGHAAGDVASRLAIETVISFLTRTKDEHEYSWPYGIDPALSWNTNRLRTAVHLANRRVFRAAESHDDYTGMGTTLVAVLTSDTMLSVAHVGDSRLYILTSGTLTQATRDDSWAATVLGQPSSTSRSAPPNPVRNVLTNVLGARDQTEVHLQERPLAPGDRLLLCTDGLHGVVDDETLAATLREHDTPESAASALVQAALERGTRDNVTALVAICEDV